MNYAGDAAEQIVRMSLEGTEFALRITGAAAKNIAAMLYAVLKEQKKTKGKARVESMLREKRPTTIYKVKKEDCPEFAKQAKRYGVKYAPIPVRKDDNTVDIMVFEDDAARVNRIVEKFDLVAENTASIKDEIAKSKQTRGSEQAPPEQAAPEKSEEDKLVDEMLEKPAQKEKSQQKRPSAENADSFPKAAENSPPSAPTSGNKRKSAEGTSEPPKKSVREELREIQAARKQEADRPHEEKAAPAKKSAQKTTAHKQPPKKRKSKSKER